MTADSGVPRVVALVPTWNASSFVAATLDALAEQTYTNLEILISDDASSDGTATVCEGYASRDRRFRVVRQRRNLGWTGNVNALLQEARGDYLVFAFQDDLLAPTYVERCVAELERNPGAVMAFSDIALVHRDGSRESLSYTALDGVAGRFQRAWRVARLRGSWWIPNRGVFRARAASEIGGLRRHRAGEFSADWPWLLQMSLLGEFVRVPEQLCTKIYRPGSLSQSWDFSAPAWSAVALSAMGAVQRAEVPAREKLALQSVLAAFVGRRLQRAAQASLQRRLRRPATVTGEKRGRN